MLLNGGGDVVRGDASELYPLLLALLELFRLLRLVFCNLVLRMVFMSDCCAGEKWLPFPHAPLPPGVIGGLKGVGAFGFCSLWTCGVAYIGSSLSSPPILASSSLSLDSLSDTIIFTLPTELLTVLLSCPIWPQVMLAAPPIMLGESSAILPRDILRPGMLSGLWPITGDESGSLCSARVEWCRLVQALEKSRPRECLGRLVAGE